MNDDDKLVERIPTPESLDKLARNVAERRPGLALAARRRAIALRAREFGAKTDAEREAIEAVLAYEETLRDKHGRRVLASRTRRMSENRGILETIEHLVTRKDETMGYKAVVKMAMPEKAFEAVVLRHPHLFSAEAVDRSRERLENLGEPDLTPPKR